ncbi:hypothetical protein HY78_18745 [Rhizorhabdus wittichii DC-6]|nr:hypothetical protein HY78_18745 [Rhizorhabdus wittichii DC-6]
MSVTAALRDRAKGTAGVASLVADRVWRDERLQGRPTPAITLQKVSDPRDYTHDGEQALRDTLIQWDVWGGSRGDCDDVGDALIAAVSPAGAQGAIAFEQSFVEADVDTTERSETETIYRRRLDIRVWWKPAE